MKFNLQNPKSKILLAGAACIVLIAVITLAVIMSSGNKQETTQPNTQQEAATAEIQITANGFEPASLIVSPNTKVTWVSGDNELHQVSSNPHPSHEDLPGLESAILNESQNYEYTFEKTGTFGYHDEQNPTLNGTIEVR